MLQTALKPAPLARFTRFLGTIATTVALATAVIPTPALAAVRAQTATPPPAVSGTLTVYAAASLTNAFNEVGKNFQAKYPGTEVRFSFAGSQQLAEQIGFGAPADVFASANQRLMDAVVKTTRIGEGVSRTFVRNRLVVIVPKANTARIRTLKDLSKPGLKLVLAAAVVPVGGYTLDYLKKASAKPEYGATYSATVLANVVSYEQDVKAVFAKVSLGEADAGVVYTTDVLADKANAVTKIDIPDDLNTIAAYPIAPLKDSPNLPLAQAFVSYVLAPEGQKTLVKYGFISTTGDKSGAAATAAPLEITGLVNKSVKLTAADLKKLKQVSVKATDKGGSEQSYTGAAIADVLKLATVKSTAKTVTFIGGDGYSKNIALADLNAANGVIVIDENGAFRNILPTQAPGFWIKGLVRIDVK